MVTAGRKVLLLAADDFEDMELLYPLYRLIEEDVAVTVAGLDDHPVTGKKGHGPVPVDTTVGNVAAAGFDALGVPRGGPRRVAPCGGPPWDCRQSPRSLRNLLVYSSGVVPEIELQVGDA